MKLHSIDFRVRVLSPNHHETLGGTRNYLQTTNKVRKLYDTDTLK